MLAQELVRKGDLAGALSALQDVVRKDASNAKLRVFLFQLLAVQGQWARALNQLNVAGELDAGTLPMVQTYREAIQCEALRADIFSGKRAPLIFGEPEAWLAQLLEAIRLDASDPALAAASRAQAFDAAPASSGSIDGELSRRTDWREDGSGLGQRMLVTDQGEYALMDVRLIEFDQPEAPGAVAGDALAVTGNAPAGDGQHG